MTDYANRNVTKSSPCTEPSIKKQNCELTLDVQLRDTYILSEIDISNLKKYSAYNWRRPPNTASSAST